MKDVAAATLLSCFARLSWPVNLNAITDLYSPLVITPAIQTLRIFASRHHIWGYNCDNKRSILFQWYNGISKPNRPNSRSHENTCGEVE